VSTPEFKRGQFKITKAVAAKAQLESAIWLWFTQDDPISVHTLAVAAHDCYHALGAHKGNPSFLPTFIKSQSKRFQRNAVAAQNFFKHGLNNLTGKVSLDTLFSDSLLAECLFCHRDLQLKVTPLMQLFWFRFLVEQPSLLAFYDAGPFSEKVKTHRLDRISRQEFFNEFLPIVTELIASKG
jgi:hypothetical protein